MSESGSGKPRGGRDYPDRVTTLIYIQSSQALFPITSANNLRACKTSVVGTIIESVPNSHKHRNPQGVKCNYASCFDSTNASCWAMRSFLRAMFLLSSVLCVESVSINIGHVYWYDFEAPVMRMAYNDLIKNGILPTNYSFG